MLPRQHHKRDVRDQPIRCPDCSWRTTWGEYAKSFKRAQLHSGGAVPAFETYLREYPRARSPKEKLLVVDRLIHEFHYSLRQFPDHPTRPAAVNLIEGKMTAVIAFLDELTYGSKLPRDVRERQAEWKAKVAEMRRGPPRAGG